jgi:hypothetical protein
MSELDAVDTLLRETEDLFTDSPRRTAPTHSAMGDCGGGVIDTGTNHSSKLFSVVKVTCSNPRLSFGMIGAGSAFCLEEECGVKSHEGTKMKFLEEADMQVSIHRNVASTCTTFTEPSGKGFQRRCGVTGRQSNSHLETGSRNFYLSRTPMTSLK